MFYDDAVFVLSTVYHKFQFEINLIAHTSLVYSIGWYEIAKANVFLYHNYGN